MKIIFLDFDGVLNSDWYIRHHGTGSVVIDPLCITLLKDIVLTTGAKIVLTTSWRAHWSVNNDECNDIGKEINSIFAEYGLYIHSKTPHHGFSKREAEIKDWLSDHHNVTSFVIFDDGFFNDPELDKHFVRTSSMRGGLCEDDVRAALEILSPMTSLV